MSLGCFPSLKKTLLLLFPSRKVGALSSYSRVEGALTWQHVADAACGPGISNLGTHGSARCLFSPSLDTMLIPHDYKSVCACMETAKPVIWVRGCEGARLLDRSGPSICRGLFSSTEDRTIGIFWSIFHVAQQDCSPRLSTRSLASKRKSSLAAKD